MKIEIFDTAISNPRGIAYFELKKELARLQAQEKAKIKAIKPLLNYGQDVMVAIYYENATSTLQIASFPSKDEVNKFCRTHDAIKIDSLCGSDGCITYIVAYKEQNNLQK